MHLHAALVPPLPLADALVAAVRGVRTPDRPATTVVEGGRPRGLLGRRPPRPPAPPQAASAASQLTVPAPDQLHLPLVAFGFVATPDARRLREALPKIAAELSPAVVHVAGGSALEPIGDGHVWVDLGGDVDALAAIFRTVNGGVERLGYYLDRRSFRPRLELGEITDATTPEHLERVIEAVDALAGEEWTVDHLTLQKRLLGRDSQESVEVARFPLGG